MGLVLWIDENQLITVLVEKVFKGRDLPFYSLNSAGDFAYLVEDLKPQVIVLDAPTAMKKIEAFRNQYENSEALKTTPFILIGYFEGLEFIQNKIGEIKKPLDPFTMPELVESILTRV